MDFTDLRVWQKAHKLSLRIYEITDNFPPEERYRLSDQLCRSASSVTANIAEGTGKRTISEYIHFISNARGSVEEAKNHLILARDRQYLSEDVAHNLIIEYKEVGKMLNGLMSSLAKKRKADYDR